MNYGVIVCHDHEGPLNSRYTTFEWEGPDTAIVSGHFLPRDVQVGDMVTIGPYRVRLIERDFLVRGWVVQRGSPLVSWLRYRCHRLSRPLDSIYRRLILTAVVWGLAEYQEYMIPSWRDLYVVKWIERRRVN